MMRRILLLLLVSAAIFEARADAAAIIVVAALAGTLASRRLPGRTMAPVRPLRLLAFLPYFAVQAGRGGLDVAVRALRSTTALRPGFIEYRPITRHPVILVIFANAVSLMPGTFTARLEEDRLVVHTLDVEIDLAPRLAHLERRVRHAFGDDVG